MVKRIGEMLELSTLKSIRSALQELGCSARKRQSATADPVREADEVVIEIDAMRVYEDSEGLACLNIEVQPQRTPQHLERLLAGRIRRPVRAVIVERYTCGGVRRVVADRCKWLVTLISAESYRLIRQDKYARAAGPGDSDDLPMAVSAPRQIAQQSEHVSPAQELTVPYPPRCSPP